MKKKVLWTMGAATLLTMGMAMTAFAGWAKDGTTWYYYHDRSGDMIKDEWVQSNGYWYYLGADGKLVTNSMIDDIYYVGSTGARATNAWVYFDGDWDDDESGWRYFASNGKAYADGMKEIDGVWYHFEDTIMSTGWVEYGDYTYYFKDSGARTTGWKWLAGPDEDEWEESWYYFTSSGKMVEGCKKVIDEKTYIFDNEGHMLTGWVEPEDFTSTGRDDLSDTDSGNLLFFDEDGSAAEGWHYMSSLDDADDYWYYFKDGKAYSTSYKTTEVGDYGMVKIGNNYYCFDEDGHLVTGLVETDDGHYFFFDEDDGTLQTGRIVITNDEFEEQEFYFATTGVAGKRGAGVTGVKDNRVYKNGLLLCAEDGMKYAIVEIEVDGEKEQYLVNESGKIKTSGTVKDGDGVKYKVTKSDGKYIIEVVKD